MGVVVAGLNCSAIPLVTVLLTPLLIRSNAQMNNINEQPMRLPRGGDIDRTRVINFLFNGRALQGFYGDTVASALAANAIKLVARSFKYHRPRGLYSAGPEEPNALLSITINGRKEVNARTTMVELQEAMVIESQNCFPSLAFDVGVVNNLLSPVLVAGFYYKTFMWPGLKGWFFYEKIIRKAAGMGDTGLTPDNGKYELVHHHCDLLIVGAGLAGITAAIACADQGFDVLLVEQHAVIGGLLSGQSQHQAWLTRAKNIINDSPNITLLTQTTTFGVYDNNVFSLVEKVKASKVVDGLVDERLHEIVATQCIMATGAIERPLVFSGNDIPGILLAGAAQQYLHRYAILPGQAIVVFCNNSSAYQVAIQLQQAGAQVLAVVDSRQQVESQLKLSLKAHDIELYQHAVVGKAIGTKCLKQVKVYENNGSELGPLRQSIACDSLLVSGGWSPTVHLHSQAGGQLDYSEQYAALLPKESSSELHCVGSANGDFSFVETQNRAWLLGKQILGQYLLSKDLLNKELSDLMLSTQELSPPDLSKQEPMALPSQLILNSNEIAYHIEALWSVPGPGKKFVDLQNDVTVDDIALAAREGYQSVEHLKRYTTLGMGTDQGKLSNINALALMAEQLSKSIVDTGTTRFRPPYTPVSIGAWAGNETGKHLTPTRRSPLHQWHQDQGSNFTISGAWLRATDYRNQGESKRDAAIREAAHVRQHAGIVDVSTLGKIRVDGPDALTFLNRVYVNNFSSLKINRARYGIMLRDDGLVFDDGVVIRLGQLSYLVTTTTAKAAQVLRQFDRLSQIDWPELEVAFTSTTDQYAAMAIAGPNSKAVLENSIAGIDFSDESLPFMGYAKGTLAGVPVEICRLSFSGELAYELYIGADFGLECWSLLLAHNKSLNLKPYGVDALDILRIEKGHFTGAEIDGRRTLDDLGMAGFQSKKKNCIGQILAQRQAYQRPNRLQYVGFVSLSDQPLQEGMQLIQDAQDLTEHQTFGHLCSVCYSPSLGQEIAVGVLKNGRARMGEKFWAVSPLQGLRIEVEVRSPYFYDPKNTRQHLAAQPVTPRLLPTEIMTRQSVLQQQSCKLSGGSVVHFDNNLTLIALTSWPEKNHTRIEQLTKLLGISPEQYPELGQTLCTNGIDIYPISPVCCWLRIDTTISQLTYQKLVDGLHSDIASVVDLSHSYCRISLKGTQIRQLFAQATAIDLRPRNFRPQHFALTRLLGIQALLHCRHAKHDDNEVGTIESFDLLVARTFSLDFWQHLQSLNSNH